MRRWHNGIVAWLVVVASGAGGVGATEPPSPERPRHVVRRTVDCPWIDLSRQPDRVTILGRGEPFGFAPERSEMRVGGGRQIAVYHEGGGDGSVVQLVESRDGGRTWSAPKVIGDASAFPGAQPRDPLLLRSPDDKQLLCIVGDGSRTHNALAMTSGDDGRTWSAMFELPASLTGDRHLGLFLPDDRLLVTFRDMHPSSPTRGDFVAWVGSYEDIVEGREGAFTCRLLDHRDEPGEVSARSGLELLADGTIVSTAFHRMRENEAAIVVRVRYTAADLDELVPARGFTIPLIDLDADLDRQVVVDREAGQYLGHPTTCLLEDGKTILCVYPKGHGRGAIVYKRSRDGGRTWSERLPTPESWATSGEVPTLHRVIDPATGKKRLIMWSGLHPARLAVSEDDGGTWSEIEPVGAWGGIVVMGFVERLRDGSYLAMFHDDGRFFAPESRRTQPVTMTLYKTFSRDGGLTWSLPEAVLAGSDVHLCEPGCIRSPDGTTLAVLLRENSRRRNSFVTFSEDEGRTFTPPRELPAALTGDRHTGKYAPDGRLFVSFRDTAHESPTQGDWVGWVGTWEDILHGRQGERRVRLKDNKHRWDTAYPGVEVLPDGTFVVTTYGHWEEGEEPYILSVRFKLEDVVR